MSTAADDLALKQAALAEQQRQLRQQLQAQTEQRLELLWQHARDTAPASVPVDLIHQPLDWNHYEKFVAQFTTAVPRSIGMLSGALLSVRAEQQRKHGVPRNDRIYRHGHLVMLFNQQGRMTAYWGGFGRINYHLARAYLVSLGLEYGTLPPDWVPKPTS